MRLLSLAQSSSQLRLALQAVFITSKPPTLNQFQLDPLK